MLVPTLPSRKTPYASGAYMDTPQGLFSAAGIWFATREADLKAFAAPVLAHSSLGAIVARTERWIHMPQTATLWLLPALLWLFSPIWAVAGSILLLATLVLLSPGVVSWYGAGGLKYLEAVVLQLLLYVAALSLMGQQGQFGAVAVGLIGFVLIRWGLLERVLQPVLAPLLARWYTLPRPDQILRAMVIRAALKYRVAMPDVDKVAARILEKK